MNNQYGCCGHGHSIGIEDDYGTIASLTQILYMPAAVLFGDVFPQMEWQFICQAAQKAMLRMGPIGIGFT
jgi:hypothetical protein